MYMYIYTPPDIDITLPFVNYCELCLILPLPYGTPPELINFDFFSCRLKHVPSKETSNTN